MWADEHDGPVILENQLTVTCLALQSIFTYIYFVSIFYRMVKRGCAGDATLLSPTIMAAVPLMLDRIYKAINEKVKKGSATSQKLFFWAYDYR